MIDILLEQFDIDNQDDIYALLCWLKSNNHIEGDFELNLINYYKRRRHWSDKQMHWAKKIVTERIVHISSMSD